VGSNAAWPVERTTVISKTAEYALRAIIQVARHRNGSLTAREIAEHTGVPPGYLAKVLLALARAELVVSQKGLNGGYALAGDPAEMTVLDVVNAVDPIRRIDRCPLGLDCHQRELCGLHHSLREATESAERVLAGKTIADLLHEGRGAGRRKVRTSSRRAGAASSKPGRRSPGANRRTPRR